MEITRQSTIAVDTGTGADYRDVVVTGDVLAEWMLAESKVRNRAHYAALFDPANYVEPYVKPVGAVLVSEILKRALAGLPTVATGEPRPRVISKTGRDFELETDTTYWRRYVVCAQYPKKRGTDSDVVWRVKEMLGIDRKKAVKPENLSKEDHGQAALVIVEQSIGDENAKHGFMSQPKDAWPPSLRKPARPDAWLVIEWARPCFDGRNAFWTHVSHPSCFGGRIVVVVTADDLRLAGFRVSRALSWELTLTELFDQIKGLWVSEKTNEPAPLGGCAHLVVSFGTSGAVVFTPTSGALAARLIYDPRFTEDGWGAQFEGSMDGFTRCLTAGIGLEIIRTKGGLTDFSGIKAGVVAARRLLEHGFEPFGNQERHDTALPTDLRFPSSLIGGVLRSAIAQPDIVEEVDRAATNLRSLLIEPRALADENAVVERVLAAFEKVELNGVTLDMDDESLAREIRRIYGDWDKDVRADYESWNATETEKKTLEQFQEDEQYRPQLIRRIMRFVQPDKEAIATFKCLREVVVDSNTSFAGWSILKEKYPGGVRDDHHIQKILTLCSEIVEYGDADLNFDFPTARIGQLFVANREELEGLTAVRELMINYVNSTIPTPLSIAVFGPPGSGKSFAIEELARNIPKGRYSSVEARTFNLSQFNGPEALAFALQHVRDDGLSGKMPLVFWDEFDTRQGESMGWLRYFLAPMQDGKYQDGSALYYVGRAIFVFAGGTHQTMDEFITRNKEGQDRDAGYSAQAIREKVPDFVSRLKGYVNVASLDYLSVRDAGYEVDAATALRRAKLLRSFLERWAKDLEETVPHKREGARGPTMRRRLNVDRGVIEAFLRVKSFRFGARSMEAIVKMSALTNRTTYDRSSLPPDNQLDLHVNAKDFIAFAKSTDFARAGTNGTLPQLSTSWTR